MFLPQVDVAPSSLPPVPDLTLFTEVSPDHQQKPAACVPSSPYPVLPFSHSSYPFLTSYNICPWIMFIV